jgi:acyl-coenzyme A synthetase/AMP-(fatty) acid ligase
VHPLPIEERISAVPGVRLVRVYGRRNALTGSIVAAEVVADGQADQQDLSDRIRAACADLPDAARPRSIKFVDTIETAGDKVLRRVGA